MRFTASSKLSSQPAIIYNYYMNPKEWAIGSMKEIYFQMNFREKEV